MITTAFLFFASFIVLFTIGGGQRLHDRLVPVDWQLTDTYFVVAHLHYVLIGINVLPGGWRGLFLVPEIHRQADGRAPRPLEFLDDVPGLQSRLLPDALSGLLGMPRRVYTYAEGMGWDWLNLITTLGSFVFAIGVLIFIFNVLRSYRSGAAAGDNPWDAPTLEWSVVLAAAALQFRGHPDGREPPSALGRPAWRRRWGQLSACRPRARSRPRDAGDVAARRRPRHHPEDADGFLCAGGSWR